LLTQVRGTEGFEFDRTVSRLFEMRSLEYLALHHERRAAVNVLVTNNLTFT
jgi:cell division protein ZapE